MPPNTGSCSRLLRSGSRPAGSVAAVIRKWNHRRGSWGLLRAWISAIRPAPENFAPAPSDKEKRVDVDPKGWRLFKSILLGSAPATLEQVWRLRAQHDVPYNALHTAKLSQHWLTHTERGLCCRGKIRAPADGRIISANRVRIAFARCTRGPWSTAPSPFFLVVITYGDISRIRLYRVRIWIVIACGLYWK